MSKVDELLQRLNTALPKPEKDFLRLKAFWLETRAEIVKLSSIPVSSPVILKRIREIAYGSFGRRLCLAAILSPHGRQQLLNAYLDILERHEDFFIGVADSVIRDGLATTITDDQLIRRLEVQTTTVAHPLNEDEVKPEWFSPEEVAHCREIIKQRWDYHQEQYGPANDLRIAAEAAVEAARAAEWRAANPPPTTGGIQERLCYNQRAVAERRAEEKLKDWAKETRTMTEVLASVKQGPPPKIRKPDALTFADRIAKLNKNIDSLQTKQAQDKKKFNTSLLVGINDN